VPLLSCVLGHRRSPIATVETVVRALKHAILSGSYRRGAALPSARDLSDGLKVNKNTVTKAYRQLESEGMVRLAPGRRATVADTPGRPQRNAELVIERQLASALAPILREARLLGLAPSRVLEMASSAVLALQQDAGRRIYLFECNRLEAQQYARDIAQWLGVMVEWKLLDDLPGLSAGTSDVFVVPYYHLDDVVSHLPPHQIVGIHVAPDSEVLFKLIEAAQAGQAALICGTPKSAARFRNLFQYYTSKGIRIAHHRDGAGMTAVLAASRTVFATPVAFRAVEQHLGTRPILFPERIEPQSLHSLRVLLSSTEGAPPPTPVPRARPVPSRRRGAPARPAAGRVPAGPRGER
jgi:DNA-binding transcriptional regulator YhcF (GntR family)